MTESTATNHTIIGIDLGTTNSALAYIDLANKDAPSIELLGIPQMVEKGLFASEPLMPSVMFCPPEGEFAVGENLSPWAGDTYVLGTWAKKRGALLTDRLVSSAKSWLTQGRVDRLKPILPWKSPLPEAEKKSPLDASAAYLKHLRRAFFESQTAKDSGDSVNQEPEVLLTVPASFDEVARELTLKAAHQAGFSNVTLIEEPLAAFYAWLDHARKDWRTHLQPGDLVLVCDIGGGTTDFSLIYVSESQEPNSAGQLSLERISVGEHLLLGGDNMDLALASHVRQKIAATGQEMDSWQFLSLVASCREAKEILFKEPTRTDYPISLAGRGSSLFKKTLRSSVSRQEVEEILLEGFFPKTTRDDLPQRRRALGIMEIGLSYESDPVISRHLARFLSRSQEAIKRSSAVGEASESPLSRLVPTAILFNGGVLKAESFKARVVELLNGWAAEQGYVDPIKVLDSPDLETSVARGAASYGKMRATGKGIRVQAGTSRSFYIGLESSSPAVPGLVTPLRGLCLVSQGTNEGTRTMLEEQEFGLLVGETVDFRFFSTNLRPGDQPGTIVDEADKDLVESSHLQVTLTADGYQEGEVIPVHLEAYVSEMGTLQLALNDLAAKNSWKLEFDVRESL